VTQMGMDVEAVESVGRQLKQGAAAVDPIVGTLDKTVSSLAQLWDGPDAQRLIQSWPTFRKSLVAAQASIAGLGQSALNNASEQRQASGATGIIGGGAVVPPGATKPSPEVPPSAEAAGHAGQASGTLQPPPSSDGYKVWASNLHDSHSQYGMVDAAGKPPGECTSWASYRRNELGFPAVSGNGYEMAGNAQGSPDTPPTLGALASEPLPLNHVMVVEQVIDSKTIRVSEMHVPVPGGAVPIEGNLRTDRVWSLQSDGSWMPSPNWEKGPVRLVFSAPKA